MVLKLGWNGNGIKIGWNTIQIWVKYCPNWLIYDSNLGEILSKFGWNLSKLGEMLFKFRWYIIKILVKWYPNLGEILSKLGEILFKFGWYIIQIWVKLYPNLGEILLEFGWKFRRTCCVSSSWCPSVWPGIEKNCLTILCWRIRMFKRVKSTKIGNKICW